MHGLDTMACLKTANRGDAPCRTKTQGTREVMTIEIEFGTVPFMPLWQHIVGFGMKYGYAALEKVEELWTV
jgi:hypothetical protein